ncbi:hypothetical protein ERJ75_000579700 [Trypanosoma vivax]|nr:hypothetical protein ERJ75_000819500 [Trypanosoma vivax]KAH8615497.1 hypothetical protein ERJ75_000579700 [Trypanosoma vivax]
MTAEAGRPEEQVRRQDAEPNVWALVWFMGNLVALLCLCRLALELLEKIAGKLFTFFAWIRTKCQTCRGAPRLDGTSATAQEQHNPLQGERTSLGTALAPADHCVQGACIGIDVCGISAPEQSANPGGSR